MARKFDFASPGIQLNEIDQSQVPAETTDDGILLVGRALKGPAMVPVKVKDLDSFIEIFGAPQSGKVPTDLDVWRDGNRYGPTYASYAAQAHLASKTSPVTFIRLLGENDPLSETSDTQAGWNLGGGVSDTSGDGSTLAYGLFIMPSASADAAATGSLAAVIYTTGSSATLRGTPAGGSVVTSSVGQLIESQATGQPSTFKLDIWSDSSTYETYTFHMNPTNKEGYIRTVLNTNPQKIDSNNFSSTEKYFLGETFEESVRELVTAVSSSAGKQYGILLPLASATDHYVNNIGALQAAKSGWIISRNASPTTAPSTWGANESKKLFRVVALHEGEWMQQNYAIKISNLKLGTVTNPNSSFALFVVDKHGEHVEEFFNLNLNEASDGFILKKIGDESREWDNTNKVFNITGDYPNKSNYIRIEMADDWKAGLDDRYALPFGFYGPSRIKGFSLTSGSSGVQAFGDVINDGVLASGSLTVSDVTAIAASDDFDIVLDGITNTITFTSGAAGTTDTAFSSNTANVNVFGSSSAEVAAHIRTIFGNVGGNWTSGGSSDNASLTSKYPGPLYTITFADGVGTPVGDGAITTDTRAGTDTDNFAYPWVKGNVYAYGHAGSANQFASLPTDMSCSFKFPTFRTTTLNSKIGGNYNKNDIMGVRHVYGTTATSNKVVYQSDDFSEFTNAMPGGLDAHSTGNFTETSFIFTLDEIKSGSNGKWYWQSGSMADGTSHAKVHGHVTYLKEAPTAFNVPLFGGKDGLDITKVDPFSNELSLKDQTNKSHYAHYTIDKAIEISADPESIKYDVVSIPGLTNSGLQNKLIRKVEERGDALAIIDIDDSYLESYENSGTRTGGNLSSVITNAQSRDLNSSYAAAYYPRIKLRDTLSGKNDIIVAPPSVAGIGAMAFSEANSDGPWFAPAGFNRGGISILGGNDGPRVVGTWKTLSKANRDELYQENINPIARFPAVGEIVIFGQKTLQQTPSALDRINVRRLMIFLKKKIGAIADTILFDQNVQSTWNRFLGQADPLLSNVKARFGITDYKLVLDSSTTTDDLIDRNIMYAKVFVKPAKAIEYIVIDFVVTRTGVEF